MERLQSRERQENHALLQGMRLIHYVFAVLRLMAPFMAIVRLLIASVYAGATTAGIHAVAAITFALLMTVLYVGTIARPIGREYCCDAKDTTCEQNNRTPCCYDISHKFSFLVNARRQIRSSRKSGQDTGYPLRNLILPRYRRFEDYGSAMLGGKTIACAQDTRYADFKMCLMPRTGMTTQSGRLFSS